MCLVTKDWPSHTRSLAEKFSSLDMVTSWYGQPATTGTVLGPIRYITVYCPPKFNKLGREIMVLLMPALHRRKIDVCCVQETRWRGAGARVMGNGMSRYKFFWQGCKDGNAGVGLLISDRWVNRITDVKRVNERIMCLKVLISDKLVTCICAYAP